VTTIENVFAELLAELPVELIDTLAENRHVRIERIISHGHPSPEGFWYDQDQNEWVCLLRGAARIRFEDRTIEIKPGDVANIPAHKKHRVEWTMPDEPTIWLAVHYGDAE
jgi:cupin 2 domain-containing protein